MQALRKAKPQLDLSLCDRLRSRTFLEDYRAGVSPWQLYHGSIRRFLAHSFHSFSLRAKQSAFKSLRWSCQMKRNVLQAYRTPRNFTLTKSLRPLLTWRKTPCISDRVTHESDADVWNIVRLNEANMRSIGTEMTISTRIIRY